MATLLGAVWHLWLAGNSRGGEASHEWGRARGTGHMKTGVLDCVRCKLDGGNWLAQWRGSRRALPMRV